MIQSEFKQFIFLGYTLKKKKKMREIHKILKLTVLQQNKENNEAMHCYKLQVHNRTEHNTHDKKKCIQIERSLNNKNHSNSHSYKYKSQNIPASTNTNTSTHINTCPSLHKKKKKINRDTLYYTFIPFST